MISRDEWLKALDEATQVPPSDPDVLTAAELGELLGVTHKGALLKVDRLLKAGKATRTKKYVKNVAGIVRAVPAFRLVKD